MARKPREKSEIAKPTILRAVRLANGDVYGPGEEDEFLEALDAASAQAEEEAEARQGQGLKPDTFEPKKEVKRLSKLGFLANFAGADDDDDEEEDLTHEHKVQRAARREAVEVASRPIVLDREEETPKAERLRTRNRARIAEDEERASAKAPKRSAKKAEAETVEAPDDGADDE